MREVLFVAGEASGDLHASGVAAALREMCPQLALAGIGGARMERAGVALIERYERFAVMGFAEVLKHIPRHAALLRTLRARLRAGNVAAVVLVDYPGFNMKVARAARESGVPVVYYVTPQVWAWGAGRLPKLARLVDRAAVILPFEEALLRGFGIDATFVGHPLLDRVHDMPSREAARATLGVAPGDTVIALFPGSRTQEVARHLDAFVESARVLSASVPALRVIVSASAGAPIDPARCPYPIVQSASLTVLRAADVALCKSGTTTLEAAIAGTPLAIAYRTSRLSYAIARRVVRIPYIGLVNIVAGREVAREFVQGALEPRAVAAELAALLDRQGSRRAEVLAGLADVTAKLGTPGAARRVAEMIAGAAG